MNLIAMVVLDLWTHGTITSCQDPILGTLVTKCHFEGGHLVYQPHYGANDITIAHCPSYWTQQPLYELMMELYSIM